MEPNSEFYNVIGKNGEEIKNTESPLHPGYIIKMELDARHLKEENVALELSIKPHHLLELMKEKRSVGAELAVKLEKVLGIDANYWLRVQCRYDLAKAREKALSDKDS